MLVQATHEDIMQRASTVLKNVHYCITLHFEMTEKANASDNPGKFREMLTRRARKGQCYHQPYLAPGNFQLLSGWWRMTRKSSPIPLPRIWD